MTNIGYYYWGGKRVEIDADQLSSLLRGTSFTWHLKDQKELFGYSPSGLDVSISAPTSLEIGVYDSGEEYEIPIPLLTAKGGAAAADVERRIHALRQLYAIILLIKSGRGKEIPSDAARIDIEQELLKEEERLQISSIAIGSVFVTLRSLVKNSGSSIVALAALSMPEARQAIQQQPRRCKIRRGRRRKERVRLQGASNKRNEKT
jgi:hypothetical protein